MCVIFKKYKFSKDCCDTENTVFFIYRVTTEMVASSIGTRAVCLCSEHQNVKLMLSEAELCVRTCLELSDM